VREYFSQALSFLLFFVIKKSVVSFFVTNGFCMFAYHQKQKANAEGSFNRDFEKGEREGGGNFFVNTFS
jgi:hypothetical protein